MIARGDGTRYSVRLSVPRNGGWRAWGAVSGEFERRLAKQESPAVIALHIVSETRRGRDYVRVTKWPGASPVLQAWGMAPDDGAARVSPLRRQREPPASRR
jgi:hypothetical protein